MEENGGNEIGTAKGKETRKGKREKRMEERKKDRIMVEHRGRGLSRPSFCDGRFSVVWGHMSRYVCDVGYCV